jgi:polar amino acid transport system substrate-binding protein
MKALRIVLAMGAAIFVSMSVTNAQQVLKVGYAPFNAPVTSLPGATPDNFRTLDPKVNVAQGALIDLLNAIAKDAGLQFQFIPVVAGEQVTELNAKKIDLMASSSGVTPENKSTIVVTAPIFNYSEALIVKKTDTKQYKTYEDLKGEVVGLQKGTVSAAALQKTGFFPNAKLYGSAPEIEKAVSDGQVKAGFSSSRISATYRLQQAKSADWQISESYQPKYSVSNSISARKDEEELLKKIDVSLAKLKKDGTVMAIFAKYGVESAVAK